MSHLLIRGDARRLPLADRSVHCCVTSPPYFGLRDYGTAGQIGLEETPDDFVAAMVAVFREVRRVLRDDGTLWLNLGDSYNAYNGNRGRSTSFSLATEHALPSLPSGHGLSVKSLKPKDLIGIPWRVAFALQADGWTLRSEVIWHKPSPMPESVQDRPTKAHETLFLLTKRSDYFYDAEAIKEKASQPLGIRKQTGQIKATILGHEGGHLGSNYGPDNRNARSVWTIASQPYPGAHFATMPPRLAERCIKAGTSERGVCPSCGSPWTRVVERERLKRERPHSLTKRTGAEGTGNACPNDAAGVAVRTRGWEPSCGCGGEPLGAIVLDPFAGSGTTLAVAVGLGRRAVGTDLNPEYLGLASRRVSRPHAPIARSRPDEPEPPLFAAAIVANPALQPTPPRAPLPGQSSFLEVEG